MADTRDPASPDDDTSSNADDVPPADWCAEQWAVLSEVLNVSDPREVVPRVRSLQEDVDAMDENVESSLDPGEIGAAFREMNEQLETLRRRNEDLVDRLEHETVDTEAAGAELHPMTEALLEELGAASLAEAQERVRSLNQQVDNLYQEKETLAEAGLMSGQEALDEINRLQRECDRLRAQHGRPAAEIEAPESPDEQIADVLGISTLEEARELDQAVRRLSEKLATLTHEKEALADTLGVSDADAVFDLVQSMEQQLSEFYAEQDASAADRSNGRPYEGGAPAEIAEILGITDAEDARELDREVRQLSERLEALMNEKQLLSDTLGVADADDLLDLVRSMGKQLSDLYGGTDPAEQRGDGVPTDVEAILGVSDPDEARKLKSYVQDLAERLDRLSREHAKLEEADLNAEKALAIIDSMEEQLTALYSAAAPGAEEADADASTHEATENGVSAPSVGSILGISTPKEARELNQWVRNMMTQLEQLKQERAKLEEFDLSAADAVQMIGSMEEQLVALYQGQEAPLSPEQIEPVEQILGVDVPPDGEEDDPLSALAHRVKTLLQEGRRSLPGDPDVHSIRELVGALTSRLQSLQQENDGRAEQTESQLAPTDQEKLSAVGVSSIDDAVSMIRSMESQLEQLYQEQEALQDLPDPSGQRDTFEQLKILYKEQEKLRRALGISDADDLIEMVEDLTAQLDELYARQESETPPDASEASEPETPSADVQVTLDSMRHQLESLYEEKRALLERGLESGEAAADRIDELQDRVQTLRQKHEAYETQLQRLRDKFGTNDVSEIIETVEELQSDTSGLLEEHSDALSTEGADDDPFASAGPSLLPGDTLQQLEDMDPADLDALSVGVLRLDDEGTIRDLNDAALTFPGLDAEASRDDLRGLRLFEQVPSTSNTLFRGRFMNGVEQGEMNARFPYTFVPPGDEPTVFFIHLYRSADHPANWLLFRPA